LLPPPAPRVAVDPTSASESALDDDDLDDDDGGSKGRQSGGQQLRPIRRQRREKKVPIIAIVGRPNVGKSALVNRIAGTQSGGAIVADVEGITRDRTYRPAEFLGERFQLVDTGGLVFDDSDALFAAEIRQQAMVAIDEAAAVILVVDGQVGPTQLDQQLADFLRKDVSAKVPCLVAVNKCESEKTGGVAAAEFWGLGLGEPMAVSALHGVGTADLLEAVYGGIVEKGSARDGFGTKVKELKAAEEAFLADEPLEGEDETDLLLRQYGLGMDEDAALKRYERAVAAFDEDERVEEINIAIVGRPNVGKSSLLNSLFGSDRAIVSDVAGTTRDSIDAVMERPPPPEATIPPPYTDSSTPQAYVARARLNSGRSSSWSIAPFAPSVGPTWHF